MLTLKHFFILVLVVGVFVFISLKKPEPIPPVVVPPEESVSTIPTSGTQCFYRKDLATPSAPYSVEEHVVLEFSGSAVSGTKSGTQVGPDMTNGYEGTLIGNTIEGEMELTFAYTIEGSQNRELEVYAFNENNQLIKKRWALKEEKINGADILVPDYVGEPTLISYSKESCVN